MKSLETAKAETLSLLAKQLDRPADTIKETDQITNLADDSIKLFEILTAFESHYQIKASYQDVLRLNTVLDIAEYIFQQTTNK